MQDKYIRVCDSATWPRQCWYELYTQSSSFLPVLEPGDGWEIGGLFFLATVTAWCAKEMAMFILNRR